VNLARVSLQLGWKTKVIEFLQRAQGINPENFSVLNSFGNFYTLSPQTKFQGEQMLQKYKDVSKIWF
jgi:hypothetical protein